VAKNSQVAIRVESRIQILRGQKVIIDADLAALYGVETRVLNQAVRRNADRFPADFRFELSEAEFDNWRSQVVMSNPTAKMGLRRPPHAFTEHGALMAATVLNSPRAIEMSLYVVRAFVQLREVLATHKEFADRLDKLERQMLAISRKHDALAATTRLQLKQVFEALRELMSPPAAVTTPPSTRPIGFVIPNEGNKKVSLSRRTLAAKMTRRTR
jgi:hypothetical protein